MQIQGTKEGQEWLNKYSGFKLGVTGHRKLPSVERIVEHCSTFLQKVKAYDDNAILLTGMALGADQIAAQCALDRGLKVAALIPFTEQPALWTNDQKSLYFTLLEKCVIVINTSNHEKYAKPFLLQRNEFLVRNCDCLLAYYSGLPSGTAHAVQQAVLLNKPLRIFRP